MKMTAQAIVASLIATGCIGGCSLERGDRDAGSSSDTHNGADAQSAYSYANCMRPATLWVDTAGGLTIDWQPKREVTLESEGGVVKGFCMDWHGFVFTVTVPDAYSYSIASDTSGQPVVLRFRNAEGKTLEVSEVEFPDSGAFTVTVP